MSIIERTACAVTGATRSLSTMKGISTACAVCSARTACSVVRQGCLSLAALPHVC